MKIECIIRRPNGSTVDMAKFGGGVYTFKPETPDGPHLCEIPDDKESVISRLLSIPSSFRIYTGRPAALVRPKIEGYLDQDEQDRLAAEEARKAAAAAQERMRERIQPMSKAELIEFASTTLGLQLSPAKNMDALRRAIVEAAGQKPSGQEADVQALRARAAKAQLERPPAEKLTITDE